MDVATELAKSKDILLLDGLKTLPVEVATGLAMSKGGLQLGGLTTLSIKVAIELANHKGVLSLNGLKTLSPKAKATLMANPGINLPEKFQDKKLENTPEGKDPEQEADENYPLRKLD